MSIHNEFPAAPPRAAFASATRFRAPLTHLIERYERELEEHRATEAELRKSIVREGALRRQMEDLLQQKDTLNRETEHRLLNGLQLITSLLSIQSRETKNAEAAALLTIAANRVAALGRAHRDLHAWDHVKSVEFKQYLESLCHDLSDLASNGSEKRIIAVEGIGVRVPTAMAIPLGLIANELITNAIKYSKGRIAVRLHTVPGKGHALSVSDNGPGLPEVSAPSAGRGLGMTVVSALVRQLGGQLQIDRGGAGAGAQFTVLFRVKR